MTALAQLDIRALREVSQIASVHKAANETLNEKEYRKLLYTTAKIDFKKRLVQETINITKEANVPRLYLFVPIFDLENDEEKWKNTKILDDGRRYIESVYKRQNVTLSTLTKFFDSGVVHQDTKVARMESFERHRMLQWMIAKKLARTFLSQGLYVEVLRATVSITTKYRERLDYKKSSSVEMFLLRVSWE